MAGPQSEPPELPDVHPLWLVVPGFADVFSYTQDDRAAGRRQGAVADLPEAAATPLRPRST